ncbi:MAG: hypothetical protein WB816_19645 [Methylocystis sp.]
MPSARSTAASVVAAMLLLSACSAAKPPPVVSAPVVVAPEPPAPGVVGSAIGRDLDEKDKAIAIAAQSEAVNSGTRKAWRGGHGAYGFIAPGPESAGCRDYTHKIFINGRPNEAKGQACKTGDSWRVTS